MKIQRLLGLVAVLSAFACGNAGAATLNQSFHNDFASNAIYLFSDNAANLNFSNVTLGGAASGWSIDTLNGQELSMSGATLSPGTGNFTVTLSYQSLPFSFQWAEVLAGGATNVVLGSGTLNWNGSSWSANNAFTHLGALNPAAPVPIPAPIWLLGSALVGLICIGRRHRRHF